MNRWNKGLFFFLVLAALMVLVAFWRISSQKNELPESHGQATEWTSEAVSFAKDHGSYEVSHYALSGNVVESGKTVLNDYRQLEACECVASGYLDLFGNTWMCAVGSSEWLDCVFVQQKESQAQCRVVKVRFYGGSNGFAANILSSEDR